MTELGVLFALALAIGLVVLGVLKNIVYFLLERLLCLYTRGVKSKSTGPRVLIA